MALIELLPFTVGGCNNVCDVVVDDGLATDDDDDDEDDDDDDDDDEDDDEDEDGDVADVAAEHTAAVAG